MELNVGQVYNGYDIRTASPVGTVIKSAAGDFNYKLSADGWYIALIEWDTYEVVYLPPVIVGIVDSDGDVWNRVGADRFELTIREEKTEAEIEIIYGILNRVYG